MVDGTKNSVQQFVLCAVFKLKTKCDIRRDESKATDEIKCQFTYLLVLDDLW